MKRIVVISVVLFAALAISSPANAQIWKRIKREVKHHVENRVVNDVGHATDKAIDKTENAAANSGQNGTNSNRHVDSDSSASTVISQQAQATNTATLSVATNPAPTLAAYKNYDFVPGDKILFETNFKNQKDAELPARLGTLGGTVEIQTYKGEKVLHIDKGSNVTIVPMIDSADYLPDQFTVEFDFLYNDPDPSSFNQIEVDFYKRDKYNEYVKDNYGDYHFLIYEADQIDFGKSIQGNKLSPTVVNLLKVPGVWHHIAIYVHDNVGKAYIDQYRVAASNMLIKGAVKLAIKTNGRKEYMIKNLRIAAGGSDAYHKIMTQGKLVTHGIHFASGKADILPESMGTINQVYDILKNHTDLNFEINGYTDNDGSADMNLKLSQNRADAVKSKLVKMGIDKSRLTTKGFGEQKPIDGNDTPEGKANNRRVEFVKR